MYPENVKQYCRSETYCDYTVFNKHSAVFPDQSEDVAGLVQLGAKKMHTPTLDTL